VSSFKYLPIVRDWYLWQQLPGSSEAWAIISECLHALFWSDRGKLHRNWGMFLNWELFEYKHNSKFCCCSCLCMYATCYSPDIFLAILISNSCNSWAFRFQVFTVVMIMLWYSGLWHRASW
jgi:hypothetical protein